MIVAVFGFRSGPVLVSFFVVVRWTIIFSENVHVFFLPFLFFAKMSVGRGA